MKILMFVLMAAVMWLDDGLGKTPTMGCNS
jgi:hypothetical protein